MFVVCQFLIPCPIECIH